MEHKEKEDSKDSSGKALRQGHQDRRGQAGCAVLVGQVLRVQEAGG